MRFRELQLRRDPACPVCGKNPNVTRLIDYQQFCGFAADATSNTSMETTLTNGIPQLTVNELKQRIDAGEDVYILDVREPYEYQIANLGGKLIPLNGLPQRLAEIDRNCEVIVHCKLGGRSQLAAEFLHQAGYPKVVNLTGGILAWADQIDPSMQKY
jgi:adenylyltransferase/sulfurtransferase